MLKVERKQKGRRVDAATPEPIFAVMGSEVAQKSPAEKPG
jgi:hypothetical protein